MRPSNHEQRPAPLQHFGSRAVLTPSRRTRPTNSLHIEAGSKGVPPASFRAPPRQQFSESSQSSNVPPPVYVTSSTFVTAQSHNPSEISQTHAQQHHSQAHVSQSPAPPQHSPLQPQMSPQATSSDLTISQSVSTQGLVYEQQTPSHSFSSSPAPSQHTQQHAHQLMRQHPLHVQQQMQKRLHPQQFQGYAQQQPPQQMQQQPRSQQDHLRPQHQPQQQQQQQRQPPLPSNHPQQPHPPLQRAQYPPQPSQALHTPQILQMQFQNQQIQQMQTQLQSSTQTQMHAHTQMHVQAQGPARTRVRRASLQESQAHPSHARPLGQTPHAPLSSGTPSLRTDTPATTTPRTANSAVTAPTAATTVTTDTITATTPAPGATTTTNAHTSPITTPNATVTTTIVADVAVNATSATTNASMGIGRSTDTSAGTRMMQKQTPSSRVPPPSGIQPNSEIPIPALKRPQTPLSTRAPGKDLIPESRLPVLASGTSLPSRPQQQRQALPSQQQHQPHRQPQQQQQEQQHEDEHQQHQQLRKQPGRPLSSRADTPLHQVLPSHGTTMAPQQDTPSHDVMSPRAPTSTRQATSSRNAIPTTLSQDMTSRGGDSTLYGSISDGTPYSDSSHSTAPAAEGATTSAQHTSSTISAADTATASGNDANNAAGVDNGRSNGGKTDDSGVGMGVTIGADASDWSLVDASFHTRHTHPIWPTTTAPAPPSSAYASVAATSYSPVPASAMTSTPISVMASTPVSAVTPAGSSTGTATSTSTSIPTTASLSTPVWSSAATLPSSSWSTHASTSDLSTYNRHVMDTRTNQMMDTHTSDIIDTRTVTALDAVQRLYQDRDQLIRYLRQYRDDVAVREDRYKYAFTKLSQALMKAQQDISDLQEREGKLRNLCKGYLLSEGREGVKSLREEKFWELMSKKNDIISGIHEYGASNIHDSTTSGNLTISLGRNSGDTSMLTNTTFNSKLHAPAPSLIQNSKNKPRGVIGTGSSVGYCTIGEFHAMKTRVIALEKEKETYEQKLTASQRENERLRATLKAIHSSRSEAKWEQQRQHVIACVSRIEALVKEKKEMEKKMKEERSYGVRLEQALVKMKTQLMSKEREKRNLEKQRRNGNSGFASMDVAGNTSVIGGIGAGVSAGVEHADVELETMLRDIRQLEADASMHDSMYSVHSLISGDYGTSSDRPLPVPVPKPVPVPAPSHSDGRTRDHTPASSSAALMLHPQPSVPNPPIRMQSLTRTQPSKATMTRSRVVCSDGAASDIGNAVGDKNSDAKEGSMSEYKVPENTIFTGLSDFPEDISALLAHYDDEYSAYVANTVANDARDIPENEARNNDFSSEGYDGRMYEQDDAGVEYNNGYNDGYRDENTNDNTGNGMSWQDEYGYENENEITHVDNYNGHVDGYGYQNEDEAVYVDDNDGYVDAYPGEEPADYYTDNNRIDEGQTTEYEGERQTDGFVCGRDIPADFGPQEHEDGFAEHEYEEHVGVNEFGYGYGSEGDEQTYQASQGDDESAERVLREKVEVEEGLGTYTPAREDLGYAEVEAHNNGRGEIYQGEEERRSSHAEDVISDGAEVQKQEVRVYHEEGNARRYTDNGDIKYEEDMELYGDNGEYLDTGYDDNQDNYTDYADNCYNDNQYDVDQHNDNSYNGNLNNGDGYDDNNYNHSHTSHRQQYTGNNTHANKRADQTGIGAATGTDSGSGFTSTPPSSSTSDAIPASVSGSQMRVPPVIPRLNLPQHPHSHTHTRSNAHSNANTRTHPTGNAHIPTRAHASAHVSTHAQRPVQAGLRRAVGGTEHHTTQPRNHIPVMPTATAPIPAAAVPAAGRGGGSGGAAGSSTGMGMGTGGGLMRAVRLEGIYSPKTSSIARVNR